MNSDQPASAPGAEATALPAWPTRYGRPPWWATADNRDQQATKDDDAATTRDGEATGRDADASRRDQAGGARERDAADAIALAQRRLISGDVEDAHRWAEGTAAVEAARAAHVLSGSPQSAAALEQAEAAFGDDMAELVRAGMQRREVREDLDRAAQHLAAAAADRRAASADRSSSAGDRSASAGDREAARTARQQAAIDRARDPDDFYQGNDS